VQCDKVSELWNCRKCGLMFHVGITPTNPEGV
jgi:ribosomal protein L37AE/L43A